MMATTATKLDPGADWLGGPSALEDSKHSNKNTHTHTHHWKLQQPWLMCVG